MSVITNIAFNGNTNELITKFDGTRFNSLTQITVPEGMQAVLFLNGKAYDVLDFGEYSFETKNIPLIAKSLGRSEGDMTEFECGVCFVNKTAQLSFEWQSAGGKKGTATVGVSDSAKFVSGILMFTDLEPESIQDYLVKFVSGSADATENPDLSEIGACGSVDIAFSPASSDPEEKVETTWIQPEPEAFSEPETVTNPEPETETSEKPGAKKKSSVKIVVIVAAALAVIACVLIAVFLRPGNEEQPEKLPETVISEGLPEVPDIDRDITITEIANAKKGDFVEFGSYEQNADESDGKEPLVWEVASVEDGNLVLLTRYCIDCVPYNSTYVDIEWKECSLRKWLNGEFYKTAFTAEEQAKIVTTVNKNALDTNYNLENGNNTEDNVYLFSITEVKSHYGAAEALRMAKATPYAVSRGIYVDETVTGCCRWWLRSPGDMPNTAAIVENDGYVANFGDGVANTLIGVRPVIRVKAQ